MNSTFNVQGYVDNKGRRKLDKNIELDSTNFTLGTNVTPNITVGGITPNKKYKEDTKVSDIIKDMVSIERYQHVSIKLDAKIGKLSNNVWDSSKDAKYINILANRRCRLMITFPDADKTDLYKTVTIIQINSKTNGVDSTHLYVSDQQANEIIDLIYDSSITVVEYAYNKDYDTDIEKYIDENSDSEILNTYIISPYIIPVFYGMVSEPEHNDLIVNIDSIASENHFNSYGIYMHDDNGDTVIESQISDDLDNGYETRTYMLKNTKDIPMYPFIILSSDENFDGIYDKDSGFKLNWNKRDITVYGIKYDSYDSTNDCFDITTNYCTMYYGDPSIPGSNHNYEIRFKSIFDQMVNNEPFNVYVNNKLLISINDYDVTKEG